MPTGFRSPRRTIAAAATAGALSLSVTGCVTFGHATKGAASSSAAPSSPASSARASSDTATPSSTPTQVPDAPTLVHDAQDVLRSAKRLTYSQDLKDKDGAYTVTTRGAVDGAPVDQTSTDTKNGTSTYRLIGKTLYLKADATYYSGDSYASKHFVGQWVHIPAGTHADKIISDMKIKPLIDDLLDNSGFMRNYLGSDATVSRDTLPDVGAAYRVHGSDGSNLWISADGKNRLLKLSGYTFTDGTTGTDRLSGYDDTYSDITAPTHPVQMPDDYQFDDGSSGGSSSSTGRGQTT